MLQVIMLSVIMLQVVMLNVVVVSVVAPFKIGAKKNTFKTNAHYGKIRGKLVWFQEQTVFVFKTREML